MNWNRALLPALFILPALFLIALGFGKDPHAVPFALENQASPVFALGAIDGKLVDSAALRGKPVVLNFWSTWCVPCKVEHEVLQQAAQRFGADVQFLGVVYQDEEATARDYLRGRSNHYPQLMDPGARLAIEFGVAGVPETFFVDAAGVVRTRKVGPLSPDELARFVTEMLARRGS